MDAFTTYTVTGKNSEVVWFFKYDLNGLLREFRLDEGTLDEKQIQWLFHKDRFPYLEKTIKGWNSIKNLNVEVGTPNLTFDTFFNAYNHKVKKVVSEKAWSRLSQKDRIEAIKGIKAYDNGIQRKGIAKAHPSTYLNQRYWEDNWSSIH